MPVSMIYLLMKKTGNLNKTILKNSIEEKIAREANVIPDECGDSLWEAVLQQEKNTGDEAELPGPNASLCHCIHKNRETTSNEASDASIPG